MLDNKLVKIKVKGRGHRVFEKALKLLNGNFSKNHEDCPWSLGVEV